jgi:hypothetical protein
MATKTEDKKSQEQVETIAVPVPLLNATLQFLHSVGGTYALLRQYEVAGIIGVDQSSAE